MKVHFQYSLNQKQKDDWTEFWINSDHSLCQQHLNYAEVERNCGRIPVYIYGEVNTTIKCIGIFTIHPLFLGNRFSFEAICRHGPVFNDITYVEEYLSRVISHCKSINVGSIRIAPYWICPETEKVEKLMTKMGFLSYSDSPHIVNRIRKRQFSSHFTTSVVDLRPDREEIIASFSESTRRMIRRAVKLNIVVRPAASEEEGYLFIKVSAICVLNVA